MRGGQCGITMWTVSSDDTSQMKAMRDETIPVVIDTISFLRSSGGQKVRTENRLDTPSSPSSLRGIPCILRTGPFFPFPTESPFPPLLGEFLSPPSTSHGPGLVCLGGVEGCCLCAFLLGPLDAEEQEKREWLEGRAHPPSPPHILTMGRPATTMSTSRNGSCLLLPPHTPLLLPPVGQLWLGSTGLVLEQPLQQESSFSRCYPQVILRCFNTLSQSHIFLHTRTQT